MPEGIFVATPMYGGTCTAAYHRSTRELAAQLAVQGVAAHFLDTVNESLITRGRNVIAATFLASDWSTLMLIDADIEYEVDDVGKLWKLNAPVACGVYTMKRVGSPYAAWVKGELVTNLDKFAGKPVEVDKCGTGFLMVKRSAFEALAPHLERETKLAAEAFATAYQRSPDQSAGRVHESVMGKTQAIHRFFSQAVVPWDAEGGIELSEDYSFCERWTRIGGKILMDPTVRLWHHGTFRYG